MKKKTLLSWSSGKDSAWALHVLRNDPQIEVVGLFSTINSVFKRVAMHAVRVELLSRQAECLGLPIETIPLPYPCSNEMCETLMREFTEKARSRGIEFIAFGDLFLEDIRAYRLKNLKGTGIAPLFPIWGKPTKELSQEMVQSGLRAHITSVDPKQLQKEFAGRTYDETFLAQLPKNVDPCGENGEFHSFAYDGPMFQKPVKCTVGSTVLRDGFVYTDLLPN